MTVDSNSNIVSKTIRDYREFWSFGFQTAVATEFIISPSDQLNLHCTYDTTKSIDDVIFGEKSINEMCMAFLFYYPFVEYLKSNENNACGLASVGNTHDL